MLLQTPINSLGYGVAGYNIAKQLAKQVNDFTIFPIGQPEPELYEELAQYDWRNKEEDSFDWGENVLKIWHQHGLHEMIGGGNRIGFPIFELNKFTKEERMSISSCDGVFVCSEWAKDIVKDQTNASHVKVVPLGVDRSIFNENNNVKRPATIFFNCGKWEIRKGHNIIKECFEQAFTQNDNVELWMMCENPFLGEKNNDWINYYRTSLLASKIRFIPRQKTHRDVYNIMRQVDVGVFPVRAEGWNLELLELLSCGKHVITTNYSGHTEFTNRNNSRIIEVDKLEVARDGIWFHGQGEWAELGNKQRDQLITHMRELHQQKLDSELDINLAGIETAIHFSWENTAKEILNGF